VHRGEDGAASGRFSSVIGIQITLYDFASFPRLTTKKIRSVGRSLIVFTLGLGFAFPIKCNQVNALEIQGCFSIRPNSVANSDPSEILVKVNSFESNFRYFYERSEIVYPVSAPPPFDFRFVPSRQNCVVRVFALHLTKQTEITRNQCVPTKKNIPGVGLASTPREPATRPPNWPNAPRDVILLDSKK